MSSHQDPTRLSQEPGSAAWLRSALGSAKGEGPSEEAMDKLAARVEAAIAAGVPGPQLAASSKTVAGSVTTGKIAVVGIGVALGVAVGSVWNIKHAHRNQPSPPAVASAASVAPLASASSVASVANTTPIGSAAAAEPTQDDEPASRGVARAAGERNSTNSGLSEAALLDEARASLRANPWRALSMTQEHGRRFPKSVLAQEREVIAIEALVRLGQTAAAKSRAEGFARHFPGSAHQQKIDQLVRGI